MNLTKKSEYEAFKEALKELEKPEVGWVEFMGYVLTSKKKMDEGAKNYRNAVLLNQHIYGQKVN